VHNKGTYTIQNLFYVLNELIQFIQRRYMVVAVCGILANVIPFFRVRSDCFAFCFCHEHADVRQAITN